MSGATVCHSATCVVYETTVHDIDELRQRLLHVWRGLEQSLIDDAVDQWQTRLRTCVRASGVHFEHTLWLSICFLCIWWSWTLCFVPCMMQRVMLKGCIIKVWNVMFSFSLGSGSTLFRWDGHFCHVYIKYFFLLTNSTIIIKIDQDFQELSTFFWFTVYVHLSTD